MDNWKIVYVDAEGFEDTIEVPGVNKFMAYAMFTEIMEDMYGSTEGIEVISAKRILD